jgi:hypothetical protein
MKVIYCIVLLFAAGLNFALAQPACNAEIKHSIHEQSTSSYSIRLKSDVSIVNAEIILHDLFLGTAVQTKVMSITSRETEIFTNLKASRYVIYVKQDGCKRLKSVGGMEGIKVGNIE